MKNNSLKMLSIISLAASVGLMGTAQAGKIISELSATDRIGFGGWNLDNIEVEVVDAAEVILGSSVDGPEFFDTTDGSYHEDYFTFNSYIYNESAATATSTPLAVLHGKDYPVGEPAGIKIVNDDTAVKDPKPSNCIITTSYLDTGYLDTDNPIQTMCSSGFQTHKRFKVNMLEPSLLNAVDLVFNVTSTGETETYRDYQVFQKMNNYTGSRLEGFTIQVGTGIGADFKPASDVLGLDSLFKLSISAPLVIDPGTGLEDPNGIWAPDQLATFSRGLFGPEDTSHTPPHFPTDGFFDAEPAGFLVNNVQAAHTSDVLTSSGPMGPGTSHYLSVPVPDGTPLLPQFGPWLHSEIAPTGIFFDDDNDPATDAALLAFWGDTGSGTFDWMFGNNNDPAFGVVDDATLNWWASNAVYFQGEIEDMLNLGLNYVVTVGVVDNTWPTWDGVDQATFTIRLIPTEDTSGALDPGYVANPPPPLEVTDLVGAVSVSPSPEFDVLDSLIISLADGDTDVGTIAVVVENLSSGEVENAGASVEFMFTEVDGHIGLYQATLATTDDGFVNSGDDSGVMFAEPGDTLMVTYTENTAPGGEDTASTTASGMTTYFVVPASGGGAAVIEL